MQLFVSSLDSDRVTTSAVLSVIFIGCRLNNHTYRLKTCVRCTLFTSAPRRSTFVTVTPVCHLGRRAHLRSAAAGLYDVPRTRTLICSRAFSVAGPKAWNSLPQSLRVVRDTTSTATLKRHLKTHLFNNILT